MNLNSVQEKSTIREDKMNFEKTIWEDIDSIHGFVVNNTEMRDQVEFIVQRIHSLLQEENANKADLYCALGYIGYHFNHLLSVSINTIECLNKSLQFNNQLTTSWLYLGYSFFDQNDWEQSLNAFNHINPDSFNSLLLELQLKIMELKICCKMQIDRQHNITPEAKMFVSQLRNANNCDKPHPTELLHIISNADYLDFNTKEQFIQELKTSYYNI